jgi:very-short-patch-repair endonuclease
VRLYYEAKTGAVLRARRLRRNSTVAEKRLWHALRSALPDFKWRRQMPIGPYIADFACFSAKLVIELDGGQHADACEQDAARTRAIQGQGYRVIRFWNTEVLENAEGVVGRIAEQLSSPSRSFTAGPSLSQGRGHLEPVQ